MLFYKGENLTSISDTGIVYYDGNQIINESDYRLTVTGLVNRTIVYTYGDILAHRHVEKVVTIHCVEGWSAKNLWEGIPVKDLLDEVGVKPGAKIVIFTAYDNFTTSLPAEYFTSDVGMLAFRINNVTLPSEHGYPLRLVADNKYRYKWIKWVNRIEVSNDTSFRGSWEAAGYINSGDYNPGVYPRGP